MTNHEILQIKTGATKDEIKKVFHKLAHIYHPDKPGGNEAKFKQINNAYQELMKGGPEIHHDETSQDGWTYGYRPTHQERWTHHAPKDFYRKKTWEGYQPQEEKVKSKIKYVWNSKTFKFDEIIEEEKVNIDDVLAAFIKERDKRHKEQLEELKKRMYGNWE